MEYTKEELITQGCSMIALSLVEDWQNYVEFNFRDVYKGKVAMAVFDLMKALENGNSFEECKLLADSQHFEDITSYHTLVSGIVRFSNRGTNYLRHTDKDLAIKLDNWLTTLDNLHIESQPESKRQIFAKQLENEKPKRIDFAGQFNI